MNVAILGAQAREEKYAYKAFKLSKSKGHTVYPVNPCLKEIEGEKVYPSLADITDKIDTLTLYVSPARSEELTDEILALKPKRIIFNPGAENDALASAAQAQGIKAVYACMLVLLSTNQF
jgi:predicted CoA-binding protein